MLYRRKARSSQLETTVWYNSWDSKGSCLFTWGIPCLYYTPWYKIQQYSSWQWFPAQNCRFWVGKASTRGPDSSQHKSRWNIVSPYKKSLIKICLCPLLWTPCILRKFACIISICLRSISIFLDWLFLIMTKRLVVCAPFA